MAQREMQGRATELQTPAVPHIPVMAGSHVVSVIPHAIWPMHLISPTRSKLIVINLKLHLMIFRYLLGSKKISRVCVYTRLSTQ